VTDSSDAEKRFLPHLSVGFFLRKLKTVDWFAFYFSCRFSGRQIQVTGGTGAYLKVGEPANIPARFFLRRLIVSA
jgi:hypothetical protein